MTDGRSDTEAKFDTFWRIYGNGLPEPVNEYRFHPVRKWRFDRAFPEQRVAVELEGGTFSKGRHVRPIGFEGDCVKYNAAVSLGWRVLRYTGRMLDMDAQDCIMQVRDALESKP